MMEPCGVRMLVKKDDADWQKVDEVRLTESHDAGKPMPEWAGQALRMAIVMLAVDETAKMHILNMGLGTISFDEVGKINEQALPGGLKELLEEARRTGNRDKLEVFKADQVALEIALGLPKFNALIDSGENSDFAV